VSDARRILATAIAAALFVAGGFNLPRSDAPSSPARATANVGSLKPKIVWHPFGYGSKRRAQMAAYSKRHYGVHTWRLTAPKVIVEHYTAGNSVTSVFNYYQGNSPDLGELPGVCAHFVIDKDGTIYQEAPLWIRCRHTVGLNYTAIGIEHVGTSDAQVLHDKAQMRASLRLTLWLAAKFHIQIRNVIGHAEALTSPYHHELYPSWRCFVHADWKHRDMITYRGLLRKRARAAGVPIGPAPVWRNPHC
jgi:N-acetylmuramoyl-L-alanine amidase